MLACQMNGVQYAVPTLTSNGFGIMPCSHFFTCHQTTTIIQSKIEFKMKDVDRFLSRTFRSACKRIIFSFANLETA